MRERRRRRAAKARRPRERGRIPNPQSLIPLPTGGSAADGQPRPWEDGPPSQEHPGLAEHDQNLVEAAVAKAIEQYQEQRGRGSVPGGLARAAAELLHPKVDPARELLAKVKYAVGCTSGFGDFTYRKPNRRQPQGGALLPAHVKPIPRVTVIVDTSGSMEQSDLALALGVIGNALRSPARSARLAGIGRRYRRGVCEECLSARADRIERWRRHGYGRDDRGGVRKSGPPPRRFWL